MERLGRSDGMRWDGGSRQAGGEAGIAGNEGEQDGDSITVIGGLEKEGSKWGSWGKGGRRIRRDVVSTEVQNIACPRPEFGDNFIRNSDRLTAGVDQIHHVRREANGAKAGGGTAAEQVPRKNRRYHQLAHPPDGTILLKARKIDFRPKSRLQEVCHGMFPFRASVNAVPI